MKNLIKSVYEWYIDYDKNCSCIDCSLYRFRPLLRRGIIKTEEEASFLRRKRGVGFFNSSFFGEVGEKFQLTKLGKALLL